MDHVWYLTQDYEYLLSIVFSEREIFPQVLGTCGIYYAVEYLDPIAEITSSYTFPCSKEEWASRLKSALQILEFLDDLESGFKEPLHLCDIKFDQFRRNKFATNIKFVNMIGVYPKLALNHMLAETSNCRTNEDCEVFDCRSKCDKTVSRCSRGVLNNNLQIVCEKVFLGWRLSHRVIVPGLLMTQFTPNGLAAILRQCANPVGEEGKPRVRPDAEIAKRLYDILVEIEQSVSETLPFDF